MYRCARTFYPRCCEAFILCNTLPKTDSFIAPEKADPMKLLRIRRANVMRSLGPRQRRAAIWSPHDPPRLNFALFNGLYNGSIFVIGTLSSFHLFVIPE